MTQSGSESPVETEPLPSKRDVQKKPLIRRTPKACDRCRLKKSKCDGKQPCKSCVSNERTCGYSSRLRRESRTWTASMQDTVEEAVQRLYRACKDNDVFPGNLPVEQAGHVTTESILHGLGLPIELPSQSISPTLDIQNDMDQRSLSFDDCKTTTASSYPGDLDPTQTIHRSPSMSLETSLISKPLPRLGSRVSLEMYAQFNAALSDNSSHRLAQVSTTDQVWTQQGQTINLDSSSTPDNKVFHPWTAQAMFDGPSAEPLDSFPNEIDHMLDNSQQFWDATYAMNIDESPA